MSNEREGHVFLTTRLSKYNIRTIEKIVQNSSKKAKINKKITTHSFRRSRASHMLDDGMDLYKVSQFLRHRKIETTMNYLKLSKKALYNDMNRIDKKALYSKRKGVFSSNYILISFNEIYIATNASRSSWIKYSLIFDSISIPN